MDKQKLIDVLSQVEHPEINNTLAELGMVKDVRVEESKASLTLALPMMGIPEAVRDHMVNTLKKAASDEGVELDVGLAEMTPEERERFFTMGQQNWKS